MSHKIALPDGRVFEFPFAVSPDVEAERQRILEGKYFLVRQGTLGEIFRCSLCNGKHQYLSLMCVERPFSGATQGLWAYYQTFGTPRASARLTPAEHERVETVGRLFGAAGRLPDLASSHPTMARRFGVADRDALLGAVSLGVLEEVPPSYAARLVRRINERGAKPPLVLPGLEVT